MKLLLNCKQASQVISRSLDKPLSRSDRMRLKLHLFVCNACSRFNHQLRLIENAVQRIRFNVENDQSIQLSSDAKARINQAITSIKH